MKKITAILLVTMLMLAGLASCGSTGGDAQDAAAADLQYIYERQICALCSYDHILCGNISVATKKNSEE